MKSKFTKKLLSTFCAVIIAFSSLSCIVPNVYAEVDGDGTLEVNEDYANHTSLQPLPPAFQVETLLNWSPANDPDARYNRGSIPLQKRFTGTPANPLANPEARLMSCSIANSNHDKHNPQGSEEFNVYAFGYWQYVDSYVYWAGTEEGIFAIPTADMIDAAHKNGVPIVATVGFPWGPATARRIKEVDMFCQKAEDGSFPVADKMMEIAEYYGFDGYFVNQETFSCTAEMTDRMVEMFQYIHEKNPNFIISWYDAMANSGGVSHQDAINQYNDKLMKPNADGVNPVDEFFCNYNWTASKIATTISTLTNMGRSPFDAFFGLDVQQNGMKTSFSDHLLLDADGKMKVSLALYCPNSTQGNSKDPEDFHNVEKRFYVNAAGDPFATTSDPTDSTNTEWVGMSRFFAEKSAITAAPFVTNFNTGHGKQYFVDGKVSKTNEWNNRSLQDILPTWTWAVRTTGEKLTVNYDFDDAYNGGNSLKFEGTLNASNEVLLYSTKITNAKTAEVVYKANKEGVTAQLGVCVGDTYDAANFTYVPLSGTPDANGWVKATADLSAFTGKEISALSIKINPTSTISDFKFNLGKIAILNQTSAPATTAIASVTLDEIMYDTANSAQVRMYWTKAQGSVSYYEVYRQTASGEYVFVNATPSTGLYISNLVREAGQTEVTLKVVPVDTYGNRKESASKTLVIDWEMEENATGTPIPYTAENVCLNATVSGVSFENASEPAAKAIDGTHLNGSKWCATNKRSGWMSIDLGEEKTVQRWRVEHAEYGGEANNMNTIDFSLSYKDESGNWVEIERIKNNTQAVTDVILSQPYTAREWRLYVYSDGSSPWSGIRIYEWQMFNTDYLPQTEPIPMRNVTAKNNVGANDTVTIANAPANAIINLYDSVDCTNKIGSYTNGSSVANVTINNLDFGPDAGRVYYTVSLYGAPESVPFSAPYLAEDAEMSPQITNVTFTEYDPVGSTVSNMGEYIFTTVKVNGLQPGDVVYVYEEGSTAYRKASLPVKTGSTFATVEPIKVKRTGGKIELQIERKGMVISDKYEVACTTNFNEPKATIYFHAFDAKSKQGLNGVIYELYQKGSDTPITEIGGSSDSGSRTQVELGEYELRCKDVPDGYVEGETIPVILRIENQERPVKVMLEPATQPVYSINVVSDDNGTVTASKSTAKEGETITLTITPKEGYQVDKVTTSPQVTITNNSFVMPASDITINVTFKVKPTTNLALNATVIGSSDTNLGGAQGPEKLFDGQWTNPDTDKWCVDGANQWVAFDIGTNIKDGTLVLKHAGFNNEWTPSPGAINTSDYKFQVLDLSKVGKTVDELLAMDATARKTLLSSADNWITVVEKTNNKDDKTEHDFTLDTASRFFRIIITKTDSTGWGPCVRLYELELMAEGAKAPEVTNVTVTPDSASVEVGKTQQFTAVVDAETGADTSVTWTVEGATSASTTITDGLLTVGSDETTTTLTVKATSNADTSKFATATVTVTVPDPTYTVTINAGANGTVTVDKATAKAGETVKLTITPATGYKVDKVTSDEVTITNNTFVMPASNVTITVTFKADSSKPEPTEPTSNKTIVDQSTGVKIVITESVSNITTPSIEVTKLTKDTPVVKKFMEAAKGYNLLSQYEIDLFDGLNRVTEVEGGKIQVSIPFPEGKEGVTYVALRYNDDGTVTEIPATFKDGMILFETDHFSTYAIAVKANTTEQPVKPTPSPQTGDMNASPLFPIVLFILSGLTLAYVALTQNKKRHFN